MFGNNKSVYFDTRKDIPDLSGKVILVNGGNNGLGKQALLEFARHSAAELWLAVRNFERAHVAADDIRTEVPDATIKVFDLDLPSLESVKNADATFRSASDRLDILMLNAGIAMVSPGLTKDGYELQFGTNHMGRALLTRLLLPVIQKTATIPGANAQVVYHSSQGHSLFAPKGGILFDTLKTDAAALQGNGRYGQSKIANVLWARHLAQLNPRLTVATVQLGNVDTNLLLSDVNALPIYLLIGKIIVQKFGLMSDVSQGVKNQLWASVAEGVESGEYYEPVGVSGKASDDVKKDDLAKKL